jgi:hypothetical protein
MPKVTVAYGIHNPVLPLAILRNEIMATKLVNDIDAVSKRFITRIGNAKGAAQDFSIIVNTIVNTRDTDVLTKEGGILSQLKAKGERQAIAAIKSVCEALYPDTEVRFDMKSKRFNWKIAGVGSNGVVGDAAALARFNAAIKEGKTLRSTLASATRGERKAVSAADRFADFIAKNGVKKAQEKLAEMRDDAATLEALIAKANAPKA